MLHYAADVSCGAFPFFFDISCCLHVRLCFAEVVRVTHCEPEFFGKCFFTRFTCFDTSLVATFCLASRFENSSSNLTVEVHRL